MKKFILQKKKTKVGLIRCERVTESQSHKVTESQSEKRKV